MPPPNPATDFRGTMPAIHVDTPTEVDEALRAAVTAGATLVIAGGDTEWGGYAG